MEATKKTIQISTELTTADRIGSWKARLGIGRMNYITAPGLYAVGNPTPQSEVLVTANYKMSFDSLRKELSDRDFWIMVIDTKGINVWCAAGKGTFSTDEIAERIEKTNLKDVVTHRRLILPQLGAPGVSTDKLRLQSGFSIKYGPIKASDIPEYIDADMKATRQMRTITFTALDRLILTPMETILWAKYAIAIALAMFILAGLTKSGYSTANSLDIATPQILLLLIAYLTGSIVGPLLLPFLPGRAFAFKGLILGLIILLIIGSYIGFDRLDQYRMITVAWSLIIPAITSFTMMNFTGASTYTSMSGVKYEVKRALPAQITALAIGIILWAASIFTGL